jgi:hypothetical protein
VSAPPPRLLLLLPHGAPPHLLHPTPWPLLLLLLLLLWVLQGWPCSKCCCQHLMGLDQLYCCQTLLLLSQRLQEVR